MTTTSPHHPGVHKIPAAQAYLLLGTGVAAPILFGLDKFTNLLTDWTASLAPAVDRLVPGTATTAMAAVGVIETLAGLVVAARPKLGGYLVAAWLAAIIIRMTSNQTFVIVGGGLAGAKAAETPRAEGFGGRPVDPERQANPNIAFDDRLAHQPQASRTASIRGT